MRRHAPGRVLGRKWSIDRSYSPQCGRPFKDAGITQFLQEEPQGFTAALKRSLFDFQVHEIDLQGEEIHLGAMGPPPTSPDVCDKWYLHFRLYKEGMDTLEAMSRLCRFLGRPPQNFRFAGHKDRCAVTVQQLSCTSLEPAKLLGVLEHQDWDHRLAFSHLEIKQNYLNLGDLSGNRFNVVMRQVPMKEPGAGGTTASDLVERRCESLKARGFLNYFGPQRFGSQLIRSDQIGAALLEHDFSRALRLILGDVQIMAPAPAPLGELLWDQAAKEAQDQVLTHWRSGSVAEAAEKALPLMPKRYNLERGVLKSLAQGLNAEETLQKLPRHLLMLYVKAAQSRTFNEVLSRRVARHGVTPQLGDMAKARSGKLVHLDEETLPMAMDSKLEVVLPLPGRAVHCPLQLRSLYEESARELLGLPLEAFSARLPFDLPLEGVYRPIIVLPQGVAWRRLDASEALQLQRRQGRLLLTDRDRLRGGEVPVDSNTRYMEELCDSGALIMSCVLPPSSYFTMAFRELTRDETVWEGFSEEKLKENPWLVG